jgi:ABC-type spermidine/putrescine transport system permease subunit I
MRRVDCLQALSGAMDGAYISKKKDWITGSASSVILVLISLPILLASLMFARKRHRPQ